MANQQQLILRQLPLELLLHVCSFLSPADHANFIRTCKNVWNITEGHLYRYDARDEAGSKALLSVILLSNGSQGQRRISKRILAKMESYGKAMGFSINTETEYKAYSYAPAGNRQIASARPLLIAAAVGSAELMTYLLSAGCWLRVNPKTLGYGVSILIAPLTRSCPTWLMNLDQKNWTSPVSPTSRAPIPITPLAYAFGRQNFDVLEALLKADHDFGLMANYHSQPSTIWRAPTTLHILAAKRKWQSLLHAECLRFPSQINEYVRGRVPIYIAVEQRNKPAFDILLSQNDIDIDAPSEFGQTALLAAIRACWTATEKSDREDCKGMSLELIERGADPNVQVGGQISLTPLIVAMSFAKDDWETSMHHQIWEIVERLLEAGADINHVTAQGKSALSVLFSAFKESDKRIEAKFKQLIETHGADVNIPVHHRVSMLGLCLNSGLSESDPPLWKRLLKLGKYLASRGGRLHPREVCPFFHLWVRHEKLWSLPWLEMSPYRELVPSSDAAMIYRRALRGGDPKLVKKVLECVHWPKSADSLVQDILFGDETKSSLRKLVLEQAPFDATGQDLLHFLLEKFEHDSTYTEKQAIHDAKILIDHGAITTVSPRREKVLPESVVDWLEELQGDPKPAKDLLLLLYRQKGLERWGPLKGKGLKM